MLPMVGDDHNAPAAATLVAPVRERTGASYRSSSDLTDTQRWLLQLMREHQFGRIEGLRVQAGQPVLDPSIRIIRAARLGGANHGTTARSGTEFELKQAVRDLFAELERLQEGLVLLLEFRQGLPFLLETEAAPR